MSWSISFDEPGTGVYTVSDAEYDGIDWGNSAEDSVQFETDVGHKITHYLHKVSTITCTPSNPPSSGVIPGWAIEIKGLGGKFYLHVSDAVKAGIESELTGPGSADTRISFTSNEGSNVHVYTANLSHIEIYPEEVEIPEPD
jgi:hypothetical protein